tara:strand:- start:266 stop:496 length:231 start_codon:yes stop_codon:yes gene_type:complete
MMSKRSSKLRAKKFQWKAMQMLSIPLCVGAKLNSSPETVGSSPIFEDGAILYKVENASNMSEIYNHTLRHTLSATG